MATNREKYIEQMGNWELAELIVHRLDRCVFCAIKNNCKIRNYEPLSYRNYELCRTQIKQWLSQEAELTADEMFEKLGYKKDEDYAEFTDKDFRYKKGNGEDRHNTYFEVVELADNTTARINTTYNKEKAKLFTKDGAIKVRDRLNVNRAGKTNVWSITKI